MLETHLFDQVADAVRSLMADSSTMQLRAHRRGVKVWFGASAKPTREHYEAQIMARRHLDGSDGMAVEIGFHAEHKQAEENDRVIAHMLDNEKAWRKQLGAEAEAGVFYGAPNWRRISEAWVEPDLDDPEFAFEVAARLVDYLAAIEPVRSDHEPAA